MERTNSAKVPDFYPEGRLELPQNLLSLKERDRRWKLVREEMERQKIDCLIIDGLRGSLAADVRYITNAGGRSDNYAVFPLAGEPTLIDWFRGIKEWVERLTWVSDIRFGPGAGRPDLAFAYVAAARVKELGYEKGNIGLVGLTGLMPYKTYKSISEMLPHAKLVDATSLIFNIRVIKSDEEMIMIREAARIADKMVESMAKTAKPGVKAIDVYADMTREALANGADNLAGTLMSCGPEVRQAGYYPEHRIIREGDVILTEIYISYGGYWGHPHQPVAVGEIDGVYEKCLQACLISIKEGLLSLKPGNTFDKVSKAFGEPILSAGFYHDHPCVHGLGLGRAEAPMTLITEGVKIPSPLEKEVTEEELYKSLSQWEVKPGMVFALEPMACSGRKGIHIGPTAIITDTGPEIISRYGREMIRV